LIAEDREQTSQADITHQRQRIDQHLGTDGLGQDIAETQGQRHDKAEVYRLVGAALQITRIKQGRGRHSDRTTALRMGVLDGQARRCDEISPIGIAQRQIFGSGPDLDRILLADVGRGDLTMTGGMDPFQNSMQGVGVDLVGDGGAVDHQVTAGHRRSETGGLDRDIGIDGRVMIRQLFESQTEQGDDDEVQHRPTDEAASTIGGGPPDPVDTACLPTLIAEFLEVVLVDDVSPDQVGPGEVDVPDVRADPIRRGVVLQAALGSAWMGIVMDTLLPVVSSVWVMM